MNQNQPWPATSPSVLRGFWVQYQDDPIQLLHSTQCGRADCPCADWRQHWYGIFPVLSLREQRQYALAVCQRNMDAGCGEGQLKPGFDVYPQVGMDGAMECFSVLLKETKNSDALFKYVERFADRVCEVSLFLRCIKLLSIAQIASCPCVVRALLALSLCRSGRANDLNDPRNLTCATF